jgi:hypothetical protein
VAASSSGFARPAYQRAISARDPSAGLTCHGPQRRAAFLVALRVRFSVRRPEFSACSGARSTGDPILGTPLPAKYGCPDRQSCPWRTDPDGAMVGHTAHRRTAGGSSAGCAGADIAHEQLADALVRTVPLA